MPKNYATLQIASCIAGEKSTLATPTVTLVLSDKFADIYLEKFGRVMYSDTEFLRDLETLIYSQNNGWVQTFKGDFRKVPVLGWVMPEKIALGCDLMGHINPVPLRYESKVMDIFATVRANLWSYDSKIRLYRSHNTYMEPF